MASRRYFGTDGVRGVVGRELTADLVERVGKAATLWAGDGRVLVGRDTRGSGPELEHAVARGIASAGGTAVLAGILPTPAVALLAADLGVVVSASHNPPEYNGVKLFRGGNKLVDPEEEAIEALLDSPAPGGGAVEELADAGETYVTHLVERFGADLSGLRIGVDCANGAFSFLAPRAFEQLGAEVQAIGVEPDGSNINVGCGATDLSSLQHLVTSESLDLGVAFDGDGDRMLAVDERGEPVDGDQILAVLALHLGVEFVAVTVMTNLGFHRLMAERGIRVVTTPVGDRYVLEALHRERGALLLCAAVRGRRSLSDVTAVMPRYPQVKRNIGVSRADLPQSVVDEVERINAELGDGGRVLVRPSGTEPVVRILAESENAEDAASLCASIAALVERELG
jgi:phosphoglucosamine mutase